MKRHHSVFLLFFILIMAAGCSTKYMGNGLNDFHRSSGIIAKSLAGVIMEVMDQDMELKAERSVNNSSVSFSDLEPVILTFDNLNLRKELTDCLVEYSGLLKTLFDRDNSAVVSGYGEDLKNSLNRIYSNNPGLASNEAGGIISSILTMAPEGMTFSRKRRFALKLMGRMQEVIEKLSAKLKEEINSLQLLAPNLYARLFREKVENLWPDKKEKRLKFALIGVKIIKKKESFLALTEDLLKVLEILPAEHRKLMDSFRKNGGRLTGLTELLDYSLRLAGNYIMFSKGE